MKRTDTPKMLPWLAHKAGISFERAEMLWRAACRLAKQTTGESETPAYWAAAVDRLLELVAAERLQEDAASFGWRNFARRQAALWRAFLAPLDAFSLSLQRQWRRAQQSG